jgi:hypothetical protein
MSAGVAAQATATNFQLAGAFAFGAVVGWYFYFANRYRSDGVKLADVATLISALGGAAVLALFPAGTDLFGAYGVGLAVGFFLYFAVLCSMVRRSKNFDQDWFLDGRRQKPADGQTTVGAAETVHPMAAGKKGGPPE